MMLFHSGISSKIGTSRCYWVRDDAVRASIDDILRNDPYLESKCVPEKLCDRIKNFSEEEFRQQNIIPDLTVEELKTETHNLTEYKEGLAPLKSR